ncbi:hypothetical protein D1BOALGB6SA_8492 [Olavius sp. associated proteobacterium Delta 1]|nr:hypothetical protein D1BOALGB6SA_8492 [Olavius sp. associated proteobacterium Delta 1]
MPAFLKYIVNFRLLYLCCAGIFFFLLSSTFDLIFIPRLDMPDHWCDKWAERRIGFKVVEECVQFTDKIQKLKYQHNKRMEERYSHKMLGIFLAAALLTFSIMLLSPYKFFDRKITFENYTGAVAAAVFYGAIIGFLIPAALQALSPSPAEWLPGEFYEIQRARTELILKEIMENAN